VIRLGGAVEKRKKKLSKRVYGTSHKVSLEEAKEIYQNGAKRLIVGAGQVGALALSDEAIDFLADKKCSVDLMSTPDAITAWNAATGAVIAVFHLTC
jgi:hypothetical protein